MRYLLVFFLLMFSINGFASGKAISITIKPSGGIVGTISFNIHPDQNVTVLVYESASKISENPVGIDSEIVVKISQLSERVLSEFINLEDYSQYPEYKQGISIAVTESHVTKSISTRRYSEQLISLIEMIKDYVPAGYRPELEKE